MAEHAEHHDGQGGDRLAGPGVADPGADEPDGAQRRRQPDAAADGHRRARRDLGRRQHRAAGHAGAGQGLRRGRHRRGPDVAPQAVPALPRHAGPGDQSDSDQGRHEAAGPRHRRAAPADDAAGRRQRRRSCRGRWRGMGCCSRRRLRREDASGVARCDATACVFAIDESCFKLDHEPRQLQHRRRIPPPHADLRPPGRGGAAGLPQRHHARWPLPAAVSDLSWSAPAAAASGTSTAISTSITPAATAPCCWGTIIRRSSRPCASSSRAARTTARAASWSCAGDRWCSG